MGWPKGKKQTPEHIAKRFTPESNAKIAATLTGYKQTPEHIAKRVTSLTGYKQTPEHIANNVKANTGKIRSVESLINMKEVQNRPEVKAAKSIANKGPNNPNWMGGISKLPYAFEFNDELKEEVRRRDNYTCQKCNTPQIECKRKLSVHHIDYDKKNSDPVNLVALCCGCNTKVNANREHWTIYFQTMAIKRDIENLS